MPIYDADGKIILPLSNSFTHGKSLYEIHLMESLVREVNYLKDKCDKLTLMSQQNQSSEADR